jgi:hypothetical protein
MSVKIMARVWAQSTRKDGELLVMLALADFANDAGESWPSIPELAQKARLTERQTRRVLIKLEQVGEIREIDIDDDLVNDLCRKLYESENSDRPASDC